LTQALSQTAAVVYVDANSWGSYSSGVMPCAAAGVVNHAVTAVGYYNALPVAGIVMDYWVIRVRC
jgi:C1A family cysteine protease